MSYGVVVEVDGFCAVGLGGLQGVFWSILVGVWFAVGKGGLQGGSRWVCGVSRDGGGGFWSIPMVLGCKFFYLFLR